MMSDTRITLLDNGMINKIAAGEVVERPLSVVKELVENSIDAGASFISVEIKEGGTSFIRVTDNGKGISAGEVRTAFLRHATSKISTIDDLEMVGTMGFRGEALSSIASVSQVELVTKTAEQETGIRIEINGGEVVSENKTAANCGTDIIVKNLFYNVPARRKFLKKQAVEGGYISDIINKLALGNVGIAFKYVNNNSLMLQTKGNGDLRTVIFQIYGKEVANSLIKLNCNKSGIKLNGYLGKPSVGRGNRNYSLIYINGRWIKSDVVQSAVEEAYKTKLMQGKFPLFVMGLEIDPRTVDVNVHPTKLEVRFSDENHIYKNVCDGVSAALSSEILIPPAVLPEKQKPKETAALPEKTGKLPNKTMDQPKEAATQPKISDFIYDTLPKTIQSPEANTNTLFLSDNLPGDYAETRKPASFFYNYRIVGQIFNTYWIIEQDSSVYLVDQHAAHERVLYERLMQSLKSKKADSQRLLQPIIIPVSQMERQIINENRDFFQGCGFELEEFDQGSFVLYAVPFVLGNPEGAGFFIEILDSLAVIDRNIESLYDRKIAVVSMISCKAAVKGNDRLSHPEARGLIEQVLKLENPFTCPHGRPTVIELSKGELEVMFKRKQP